jgi:ABC-2 type transport system ATP-binding protein
MPTTQSTVTKHFKCPSCSTIEVVTGSPGEPVVVTCPSCKTTGKAILPATSTTNHTHHYKTGKAAITITHLKKMFGDFTAVDDVSFQVMTGEIFGLLGPNGAGKSTIIRMLCTLTRPTSGTATIAGFDIVTQDSQVRTHIGLVSEKMIMYDDLTARENLALFGRLYNIPEPQLQKRINELLAFVRMDKWADARIGTFSTGMKQRINVIRALVNQPAILFLDEPTLGLDPQSTSDIRDLIRNINTEQGTTIILTTHMMAEADMLCDRIGIIDKGNIVALDTPANLKKLVNGTDTTVLDIQITNLTPAIIAAVQASRLVQTVTQEDETHIKTHVLGPNAFDTIIDLLRKHGAKVALVRNIEPSLEDVFLHLTGRQVREKVTETVNHRGRGGHGPGRRRATARVR